MEESQLLLIPTPRQVSRRSGRCKLENGGQIVLQPAHTQELLPTARRLIEAMQREAQITLSIVAGQAGAPHGAAVTLTLDPERAAQAQGYTLSSGSSGVSIVGHDLAGLFYGVCTLIQLVRQFGSTLPGFSIVDYPDYAARGVMLDVSRSKVPTMETLKNLIDMLAGLKVNQIQLYLENAFAYREHADVWAGVSPLTGQDILELDAFCSERFIDLVPNQNSFGHMRQWLLHPRYKDLAEAPEGFDWPWGGHSAEPFSLNPLDPRCLDLLRSLYDDLLPHFTSRLFNVGLDETVDLGTGRSAKVCEVLGVHQVYLEFLLKVYQLVQERRRTMMFWGDIILHEPKLIPDLPRDAIALEWGYEHDHPFDEHGAQFAAAGVPFYVCPGTSSWNSLAGRTDNAMGNLRRAAQNGLQHGAVGYLNTDWGDHGHWQYLPISYLGYAYGAAVSWAYEANAGLDLPAALSMQVFADPTETMGRLVFDLGNVYRVYERVTGARLHNNSFLAGILYQPVDELVSRRINWAEVSAQVFREARREIDEAMDLLPQTRMRLPDAPLIRREFENTARLLRHACALGEFKVGLAGLQPSAVAQKANLARQAADLAEDLRMFLVEHRQLWLARNRVGGLEEGSGRYFEAMAETYWRLSRELD